MRGRRALAIAAVLAAIALLWWSRSRAPGAPSPPLAPTAPVASSAHPPPPAASPSPRRPPAHEGPAASPPIIDAIDVEKREVCEGEDSLVTIRAHTPGHTDDAYLHYVVAGRPGQAVPIRGIRRDPAEGEPPSSHVRVFGRNNVVAEAPLPAIRTKACRAPRVVHVQLRLLPNGEDDFELHAQVVDVAATTPLRVARARWQFGDGTTGESAGPTIEHSYRDRPQQTLFSQLLVQVELIGDRGERVIGRTALQLLNPAFEHLAYRGIVRLSTVLTPRFPTLDDRGVVTQRVRLWHHHDAPVTLTRVVRRPHLRDQGPAGPPEPLDPAAFLGATVLAASGLELAVALDTRARPDALADEYVVEGTSADGFPAIGAFTIMRPPDPPTRERSTAVLDPALKARILRARARLGRPYVTDEDLRRLELDGAFADLPPRP